MFINLNKINILNFIISLIPLSIIIGNFFINLNIILICILGYYIYGNEIFNINNKIYKKLIFLFFILIIISSFFNNFPNLEVNDLYRENLFKSFIFLRYLFLFLVISKFIEKKHFNYKLFFISSAFFSTLLAIDIIFQVILKKDLIGNPIYIARPSGFFGEETIAGGYLQKFGLFTIILVYLKSKNNIFFFSSIIFFLIVIILTNNRMPLLLYVFSIILYFVLNKNIKEIFFLFLSTISIFFLLLKFPVSERFNIQSKLFYKNTVAIMKIGPDLFYNNYYHGDIRKEESSYLLLFNTGVQLWKKNKIFGNGLKSFGLNCKNDANLNMICNNHPHNYFIQLMLDVGLLGLFTIYTFVILTSGKFFKYYFSLSKKSIERKISIPIFLIIITEFFPIRSTGDFFSTNNATIIFLFLAFFFNINNLKKFKLNKLSLK